MPARAAAPPSMDWQASLFGAAEPTPDRTFASVERLELGDGAWVSVSLRHRAELDPDGDSWYEQTGRRKAPGGGPAVP